MTFAEGIEEYPAWSPDGKQIAYVAQAGQVRRIFRKDLASGQDVQVTHGDYDELQPGDVFGEFGDADVDSTLHPARNRSSSRTRLV